MRHYIGIILLVLFAAFKTAYPNPYIDSLKVATQNAKNDSVRFDVLSKIAIAYSDSAYSTSLEYWKKALKVAKRSRNRQHIADVYQQMGYILFRIGEFPEALNEYNNSLTILHKINDHRTIAEVHNDIGLIYKTWGRYDKALEHYSLSIDYFQLVNDISGEAMATNNIGQIYYYQDEFVKAIDYFKVYLDLNENANVPRAIAGASNNIAAAYVELEKYDLALNYYQKALNIYDSLGVALGVAILNDNIGSLLSKRGFYSQALDYHFSALNIFSELQSLPRMGYTYKNIGIAHLNLNNNKEATKFLLKSKEISIQYNQKETLKEAYLNLSKSYQQNNNYKEALEYHKLFLSIKDSLNRLETADKLNSIEVKYEAEKRSRELMIIKNKLKQTKYILLGFASFGFLLFLILGLLIRAHNIKKRLLLNTEQRLNSLLEVVKDQEKRTINKDIDSLENFFTIPNPNNQSTKPLVINYNVDGLLIILTIFQQVIQNELLSIYLRNNLLIKKTSHSSSIIEDAERIFKNLCSTYGVSQLDYHFSCFVHNKKNTTYSASGYSGVWIISPSTVDRITKRDANNHVGSLDGEETICLCSLLPAVSPTFEEESFEMLIEKTLKSCSKNSFSEQKEIIQSTVEFWSNSFNNDSQIYISAYKNLSV